MSRVVVGVAVAWAAGCRSRCDAVIIDDRGVEPFVLDRARESVDLFFELLDPGVSVCLRSVTFKPDVEGSVGNYRPHSNRVTVNDGRGGLVLDSILWHELGHAVFEQNALDLEPEWFEAIDARENQQSHRRRINEGFAQTMQYGPSFAKLVHESCPDDAPGVQGLRQTSDLFTGADARTIADDFELVPMAVFPQVPHGEVFGIDAQTIEVRVDEGARVFYIDLPSLTVEELGSLWDVSEGLSAASAFLPTWVGGNLVENNVLFYPFVIDTPDSEVGAVRWIRQQDYRWQGFGCVGDTDVVLEVDGNVWMLRWEDMGLQVLRFRATR